MYTLHLKHHFCAAHQLTNAYSKECNDFKHGHNFKVEIIIEVTELINNMVIDFKIIKEIIDELDHKDLNKILDFEPTAEKISEYLYNNIKNKIKQTNNLFVEVWEADDASIKYTKI